MTETTLTHRERDQHLLEHWTNTVYDRARRGGTSMVDAAAQAAAYRARMQLTMEPCSNLECDLCRYHDGDCVPFAQPAEVGP